MSFCHFRVSYVSKAQLSFFSVVSDGKGTFEALIWTQRYGGTARYANKSSEPTDFLDLRRRAAPRTLPTVTSTHLYAHTCASEKRNEREGIYVGYTPFHSHILRLCLFLSRDSA